MLGLLQELTGIPAARWLDESPFAVGLSLAAAEALAEVRKESAEREKTSQSGFMADLRRRAG